MKKVLGEFVMQYKKVEICGVDTSQLPVLKEADKERLLKLTKEGNKAARAELINGNLRLVLSVIQRFSNRGENPDDLFQVGCIGLIKSIDNFDITQNVRFSTYAVPPICECRENLKGSIYNDTKTSITRGNRGIIRTQGKRGCNT